MARRLKLLTGLSTAALAGAALAACGEEGDAESVRAEHRAVTGEGEGEGGEGEGKAAANAATDKVAYLAGLMMVAGHLETGAELYAAGQAIPAAAHMAHPLAELYTGLEPAFRTYGAKGFEDELKALTASVETGDPAAKVQENLTAAKTAVHAAIVAAGPSAKETMLAAAEVLRAAGEEFDVGVKGGSVVNAAEYQDAYGFIKTAADALAKAKATDADAAEALALAREQSKKALTAAPSPVPPAKVDATSAVIYGAAARIEIAALGLQ